MKKLIIGILMMSSAAYSSTYICDDSAGNQTIIVTQGKSLVHLTNAQNGKVYADKLKKNPENGIYELLKSNKIHISINFNDSESSLQTTVKKGVISFTTKQKCQLFQCAKDALKT